MPRKKFHEIMQDDEGCWRLEDGRRVNPRPEGRPINKVIMDYENPYDVIKSQIKKQGLWDIVDSYDLKISKHRDVKGLLLGAHLYRIENKEIVFDISESLEEIEKQVGLKK